MADSFSADSFSSTPHSMADSFPPSSFMGSNGCAPSPHPRPPTRRADDTTYQSSMALDPNPTFWSMDTLPLPVQQQYGNFMDVDPSLVFQGTDQGRHSSMSSEDTYDANLPTDYRAKQYGPDQNPNSGANSSTNSTFLVANRLWRMGHRGSEAVLKRGIQGATDTELHV
ncbi:hypothetical protein VE00_08633 [Pseudogymnoascus sp. WSF 3629]|nr:hypothetical protein VE00_08633 [Pseudogymnoascus sp. WSF 3629]